VLHHGLLFSYNEDCFLWRQNNRKLLQRRLQDFSRMTADGRTRFTNCHYLLLLHFYFSSLSPSSYHPFLFYFLCYFWWHQGFLVAEAGCFRGLRSKCERGREVGIPKLSLFPSLHFLVFLLLYLLAVKLGECKAKEFRPPKKTHIGIANKRC